MSNTSTPKIVVGADGSDVSAHAMRWAAAEADARGWSLTAVMVWDYLDQHHPDGSKAFDPSYDAAAANSALKHYVVGALGVERAETVTKTLVLDLPAHGLVEASKDASLLVLGARGRGGFKGLLLGSVSARCLNDATCPVAILRPAEEEPVAFKRVVVGIDGSNDSRAALAWAAEAAVIRGATLTVVHTAQVTAVDGSFVGEPMYAAPQLLQDAQELVTKEIETASLPAGLHVDSVIGSGSPGWTLIEASQSADLVVVGRSGRGKWRKRLLGSVATQVSHHAACPAVFVNPGDDD